MSNGKQLVNYKRPYKDEFQWKSLSIPMPIGPITEHSHSSLKHSSESQNKVVFLNVPFDLKILENFYKNENVISWQMDSLLYKNKLNL